MNWFKGIAATLIGVVGPMAWTLVWGGLAVGYDRQHVHDKWATNDGTRVFLHQANYTHSTGGIIAIAGVLTAAWVATVFGTIVWAGYVWRMRNERWFEL